VVPSRRRCVSAGPWPRDRPAEGALGPLRPRSSPLTSRPTSAGSRSGRTEPGVHIASSRICVNSGGVLRLRLADPTPPRGLLVGVPPNNAYFLALSVALDGDLPGRRSRPRVGRACPRLPRPGRRRTPRRRCNLLDVFRDTPLVEGHSGVVEHDTSRSAGEPGRSSSGSVLRGCR